MARSRQGGTRGFIRGRVGNDLFQVTKDASGRKIQLVKAVEDTRINNNTERQAVARMQMALCMGCLSQFKEIVDHSWEGIPYGQLSIAHFVKRNIPLIQEDCKEHWEDDNRFNYPLKGVPALRLGEFLMSEGTLVVPGLMTIQEMSDVGFRFNNNPALVIQLRPGQLTMADLKSSLGLAANDYITVLVMFHSPIGQGYTHFVYRRFYIAPVADDTEIGDDTIADIFTTEGTAEHTMYFDAAQSRIICEVSDPDNPYREPFAFGTLVLSRWNGNVWQRNTSRFQVNPNLSVVDYLSSPNEVFGTWFDGYDSDNPYNPTAR